MSKEVSVEQLIETIKGKVPQSGVIASILSAAMGAALAMKILEALNQPGAKALASTCAKLQSISKFGDKELSVDDLIPLAKAALTSLQTIEGAMQNAPGPLRSELLIGAMCSWTGLEGTIAMAESKLRLSDSPNDNQLAELAAMRQAGKVAGKSAETIAKKK